MRKPEPARLDQSRRVKLQRLRIGPGQIRDTGDSLGLAIAEIDMADREIGTLRPHPGQTIRGRVSGTERGRRFTRLHFDRQRQPPRSIGIVPLFACAIGHRIDAVLSLILYHDGSGPVGHQPYCWRPAGTSPLHVNSPPTATECGAQA